MQYILLLAYTIPLHGQERPSLPIKEIIIGVNVTVKNGLYKHSIYQPPSTFLGMPIKKWMYQCGNKRYNVENIKKEILSVKKKYADKISNSVNKNVRNKLISKRDKLIQAKETTLALGNRFMRMGEKPLYYDPTYVEHNKKIFLNYLQSKGYIDASITSKTNFKKKRVYVTYDITPQKRYFITDTKIQTNYKRIEDILMSHQKESYIKQGAPYQYQDCVNERERIIILLSNNGYFELDEQDVYFIANVSQHKHTIGITTVIQHQLSTTRLVPATIGRVVVDLTPHQAQNNHRNRCTQQYEQVDFIAPPNQYPLAHLVRKITIRPGDSYNKSKIIETYERLHSIATFESITILPKLEDGQIVVYIHVKPYPRVTLQTELGGECMNLDLKRFRPTMKFTPTIRRVFNGLGVAYVEISMDWKEAQLTHSSHKRFYNNAAYGLRLQFTTPCFIFYLPKKTNLLLENFSPSTIFDIGCSYIKHPTSSEYKINTELNYKWFNRGKNITHQLIPLSSLVTYPKIQDATQNNSADKPLPSFLTHIGYTSIIRDSANNLYFNTFGQPKWMISIGLENGGLYETLMPIKKIFFQKYQFQFYQYIKFDLVYRHSFRFTQDALFVYQFKLGFAQAYGASNHIHPDKQYKIGEHGILRGSSSKKTDDQLSKLEKDHKQAQSRSALLLANIELRKKLVGHLESALFLDVGNAWNARNNAPTCMPFDGKHFYKMFTVGGGCGLRLNFYNTFVLCCDVAIQLHNPSVPSVSSQKHPISFILNIGYPF